MVKHRRLLIAATALARVGLFPSILGSAAAVCCTLLLTLPANAQLQHRWSFTNDATDSVGSADWMLQGNATVSGGQLVLDGADDDGLSRAIQDGSTIAINTYPAITLELWATPNATVMQTENDQFTTLAGFGADPEAPNDTEAGTVPHDSIILQTHRGDDVSRVAISINSDTDGDPWTEEDGANGAELNDNMQHHYVGVITNDSISLYVDGVFAATNPVGAANGGNAADNMISALSNDFAWIGYAYGQDPLWTGEVNEYRIFNEAATLNYAQRSFEAGPDTLVDFTPVFDLALVVNTSTGETSIENISSEAVSFNYYLAESEGGALDPTNWNSLSDQEIDAGLGADFDESADVDGTDLGIWEAAYGMNANGDADGDGDSDGEDFLAWQRQFGESPGEGDSWDEAGGSNENQLAELFLNGFTTLGPGDSVSLGNAFNTGGAQDLTFEYASPGAAILIQGEVQYVSSLASVPEPTTLAGLLSSLVMFLLWGRPRTVTSRG